MNIVHPLQPVNGLNPEDVFYAVDDLGTQTGYGFILYQYHPGLYPDCPVNLYFSIDGDPASRYLLFGALTLGVDAYFTNYTARALELEQKYRDQEIGEIA